MSSRRPLSKIVVDEQTYLWTTKRVYQPGVGDMFDFTAYSPVHRTSPFRVRFALPLEALGSTEVAYVYVDVEKICFSPRLAAQLIRQGLENGWYPLLRNKPVTIEVEEGKAFVAKALAEILPELPSS